MSTKFPTDYDDATTLGPVKIDVTPPADPQRNIAAEYRNNMDDAMLAVQTRIGKLDDPTVTSVDWGMLTISGAPNQGLRVAGAHAAWPGALGESGLFIDSGSGNIAYHKGGDPAGTFTDLTTSGVSTWDALYALDKALDINAAPLTFTQTTTSNSGFVVNRDQATSNSPIVSIDNLNAADTNGTLKVSSKASGPAVEISQTNTGGYGLALRSECNSSAGTALYVTSLNTSATEGNAYTFVLNAAKPVKVYLDPATYITRHLKEDGQYKPDFFYNLTDDSSPASLYWECRAGGVDSYNKRMAIPLPVPNKAVLTSVEVWGTWGGGSLPASMTDRPRLELLEKDSSSSTFTVLKTVYASAMTVNTIVLSGSFAIDRTKHSYSLRFRTALSDTVGVPILHAAFMTYDVSDLGAAIGTNG